MNRYIVDEDTRIFLYGAGSLGSIVGKYLMDNGFRICGYIDQRAEEIHTLLGLPCYRTKEFELIANKESDVILVVVKDVFEHERIKEVWLQAGFKRIIYKPMPVIDGKGSDGEREISRAYDLIVEDRRGIPREIPLAENTQSDSSKCIILEGESSCVAYIPSELIYTNMYRQGKHEWGNVNIHAMVPHILLFWLFSNNPAGDQSYYLSFAERVARREHVEVTAAWRRNVLRNRQNVYLQMQQYLAIDSGFFIRNAPEAEWNDAGHFNLKSGKHRSSFLASKKMPYIPCRISKEDFRSWEKYTNKASPESPFNVGRRDPEAEFWKEVFSSLVFAICRMNLDDRMVPMYRGKSLLNLTKSGDYLERNLKKFGLQMCAEGDEADYVLVDTRFDAVGGKAAREATFLIYYNEATAEEQSAMETIWRGFYAGEKVFMTVRKEHGK